jgi:HEAT repeat protein
MITLEKWLLKLLSDENYYVRLEAISALKKIGCGCEEVASKLLYIVEAEGANSLLYARAAEALGQVGSPSMLPDLHRILHNQPLGSYPPCTSTISAIQKRCQFYNYKI